MYRALLSLVMFVYVAFWFLLLVLFFIPWLKVPEKWGTMYFDPIVAVCLFFSVGAFLMVYLSAWGLLLLLDR